MFGDRSVLEGKNPTNKDKTFRDDNLKKLLSKSIGNQALSLDLVVKDR